MAFDFEQAVIERSKETPVLVDFWAPWCAPCRAIAPLLEKLAAEADGRWELVKVNTDEEQLIAQRYRIQGIPALKLFTGGQVTAELQGALPEQALRSWLQQEIPSDADRALAMARASFQAGDHAEALKILEQVHTQAPDNKSARAWLARALLLTDPDRALTLVENVDDGDEDGALAGAVRVLGRLMHLRANPPDDLKMEPASDSYLAGIDHLAQGRHAEAAEAWLQTLKKNRRLDDDGAKQACLALFQWLGNNDVSREYRRQLATALF